jgi:hypothetical protein
MGYRARLLIQIPIDTPSASAASGWHETGLQVTNSIDLGHSIEDPSTRTIVLRNLPRYYAIVRSLSQSLAIRPKWYVLKFQIPYKLLFTHFMERSASVANIKCEEVTTYLPIYAAGYLGILSDS